MREIKFRAWDKKCKYMDDDIFIHAHGTLYDYAERTWDTPNIEIEKEYDDNLILMQYTGLKDKNGKEIYEGDIVRDTENNIYVVDYDTKYAQFVLKEYDYVNNSGVLTQCDYNGLDYYYTIAEWGEVIGNIYENPELLEGEANE